MQHNFKRWIRRCSSFLLVLLTSIFFLRPTIQRVFYLPDQVNYGHSPAEQNLAFENVIFPSSDGTRLHGWFVPAVNGAGTALGTVIHMHGNAANITNHWAFVSWLPEAGYNVLTFDYRNYGQSEKGKLTAQNVFEDAQSVLDYIRTRSDIDPDRLLVLGQSLGGNNAIAAVAEGKKAGVCAMVIDSTFFSYSSIANDKFRYSGLLINDRYSAANHVLALAPIPILFLHGTADQVINYQHSERLYHLAAHPKQIIIIPGLGHIMALAPQTGSIYQQKILRFFQEALHACPPVSGPKISSLKYSG